MDFEILTGRIKNDLVDYKGNLLHKDLIPSLKKLEKMALTEIGAKISIVSSYRDFERQRLIWNDKAMGKRDLYNKAGTAINYNSISENELLNTIMFWSAIPGTSRHHWGTDFDIYDASKVNRSDVQLTHSECDMGGPFFELHTWLSEKIESNQSFNFFRPYDKDRGGVQIEKWHLSYSPVSSICYKNYSLDTFRKNINLADIKLKALILERSEEIYNKYLINVGKA